MQTGSTLVGLIASSLLTFGAMVPIQRNAMGSGRGRAEPERMVEDRRYELEILIRRLDLAGMVSCQSKQQNPNYG
jgi:hypothetical protein